MSLRKYRHKRFLAFLLSLTFWAASSAGKASSKSFCASAAIAWVSSAFPLATSSSADTTLRTYNIIKRMKTTKNKGNSCEVCGKLLSRVMFRQFVLTFYRRCGQVGSDDLSDDEHKATEDLLVDCGSYLFFLSRVRVRTLFWTKNSRTFQGLSRTHFPFCKDSIQRKIEPWVHILFSSSTTWVISSRRSFCVFSFFFGCST